MLSLLTCKSQKTALMSRTTDSPKEKTEAGEECFEIVVSVVFCVRVKIETTKHLRGLSCTSHTYIFMDIMEVQEQFKEYEIYLHADDGVDEEEHGDE